MFAIAREGALKIKELSYIHAEGYSSSSLKHGPFALLDKNVTTILIIDRKNKEKMMNAYNEIKSRDVNILVISELKNLNIEDYVLLPENGELQEIINIVFLQHLCYKLAIKKGINPDFDKICKILSKINNF